MNDFDFLRRFFVIIIAVLQPFIINFYLGDMPSISSVWGTPLQPLFIIVNAMVSYLFFEMPKWRIPAFLLLFLTAFSVTEYPIFHTVLAVLFFIGCVYGINSIKRFRWYLSIFNLRVSKNSKSGKLPATKKRKRKKIY